MLIRSLMRGAVFCALLSWAPVVASAAVVVLPGDASWGAFDTPVGASATITGAQPRSGNGSLELSGNKTRFGTFTGGAPFLAGTPNGFGLLSDVNSLTFDWQIAVGSTNPYHADYTPALRLHVYDPGTLKYSELIWEGAYNGTYGSTTKGDWYKSDTDDLFTRWVTGGGASNQPTTNLGALVKLTINDWATMGGTSGPWYSAAAYVVGISAGSGSGTGAGYHAFADNLTLDINGNVVTYNFELTAAPVPEPASLAVWSLIGLTAAGTRWRKRVRGKLTV